MAEYTKRPLWQWILFYVLIGAVVYAVIYFAVLTKNTQYKAPNSANPTDVMIGTEASPDTYVTNPPPEPGTTMTIPLASQNDSGESGKVTLEEIEGKVNVTMTLTGAPSDDTPQPAHIHTGSCPDVGAVKYPLTSVVGGASATVLPVSMDELKASLPLAINVHKSQAESSVYVSCGDLSL